MMSDLLAGLRRLVHAFVGRMSPGELAVGFTVGMIIGVMPKTNLIALSLCVVLFSLRCNKALGLVAAVAFSFVGPALDPFAHRLGLVVLSIHSLQGTYASVLNWPLGPWFGFNNTVVAGTFLLGLYVAYPAFWLSRLLFSVTRSLFTPRMEIKTEVEREIQLGAAA
jgi:uncharacterized protein (TIGR03546 family)